MISRTLANIGFVALLLLVGPPSVRSAPGADTEPRSAKGSGADVPLFSVATSFIADPLARVQPRVVMIVLDGVRTEEFFQGAYQENGFLASPGLLPFVYGTFIQEKQSLVLGNRFAPWPHRCIVNNNRFISLPGYADLLGAVRQANVVTNTFNGPVAFPTVVDRLLRQGMAPQEMAVFASWKHIRNIVTQQPVPGLHVDTGRKSGETPPPWHDARYDEDLMDALDRYLNREGDRVRFLFVAFNDSDEWAHKGQYGRYIQAIQRQDDYIRRIYEKLEANPAFHNHTTYIVTTDHGRGTGANWIHHGPFPGSQYIWAVVHSPRPPFASPQEHFYWKQQLYAGCSHAALGSYLFRVLNTNSSRAVEIGKRSGFR